MRRARLLFLITIAAFIAGIALSILLNSLFIFLFLPFGFGWGISRRSEEEDKEPQRPQELGE